MQLSNPNENTPTLLLALDLIFICSSPQQYKFGSEGNIFEYVCAINHASRLQHSHKHTNEIMAILLVKSSTNKGNNRVETRGQKRGAQAHLFPSIEQTLTHMSQSQESYMYCAFEFKMATQKSDCVCIFLPSNGLFLDSVFLHRAYSLFKDSEKFSLMKPQHRFFDH